MKNIVFLFTGILVAFSVYFFWYVSSAKINKKVVTKVVETHNETKKVEDNNNSFLVNQSKKKKNIPVKFENQEVIEEDSVLSSEEILEKEAALYGEIGGKIVEKERQKVQSIPFSTILNRATKVKMKIKAKEKEGMVKVKVSLNHPMLTYLQAQKQGLSANFITHIYGIVDGKLVYDATTSQFLSKNPLIKFTFQGKKFQGKKDKLLTILYVELNGSSYYASKKIR